MEHELLKKEKIDELYDCLFEHGHVECGNEAVEDFISSLGDILHRSKSFKGIKHGLKNNPLFRQRFEEELRRAVTEGMP